MTEGRPKELKRYVGVQQKRIAGRGSSMGKIPEDTASRDGVAAGRQPAWLGGMTKGKCVETRHRRKRGDQVKLWRPLFSHVL